MPRPGYIICSISGSQDEYTKSVSLFNVIEAMEVEEVQEQPGRTTLMTPVQMRITTVWLREETDQPEQEFQARLSVLLPGSEEPIVVAGFAPFQFRHFLAQRLIVPDFPFRSMPLNPGFLRFVSQVRRSEDAEWTCRQEFAILVRRKPIPAEQPAPPQATPQAPAEGAQG
jgi:hypothetical protein